MSEFDINSKRPRFSGLVRQFFVTCVATIGVFGLGTVLCWTSPALPDLEDDPGFTNLTTEEKSWIGALATVGALTSAPFAGVSVDKIGRKKSMIIFSIPFIAGWVLVASSTHLYGLLIGRFLTGFCGGGFSLAAPIYISETAADKVRGSLANIFQLMLVLGILFTYVVGTFVSWRHLAMISAIIPITGLILTFLIPESPRYLLSVDKVHEAARALRWLRNPPTMHETDSELFVVQTSLQETRSQKLGLRSMFAPHLLQPILICLSLMVFEQLSGFCAVIFYTGGIFKAAGSSLDFNVASILVGIVQVLATIVSTLLVDRSGRRILLIGGQIGMAIPLVALGSFFTIKDGGNEEALEYIKWLPLLSLIVFISAFSFGIGPLSWTIMSEILPPNVKGSCTALATSLVWLSAFIVTKTFDNISESLGINWCFFIFAIFCLIGLISIYFTVPETKGKSLEEIQRTFSRNNNNNN